MRNRTGSAVLHFVLHLDAAADDLLGRNAVHAVGPRPHEIDPAAGDDERLEVVRAEIRQDLQHRLIDELRVQPIEARVLGRFDPIGDDLREFVGREIGVAGHHELHGGLFAAVEAGLHVAGQDRLVRLFRFPFGMLRRERLDAVDREHDLRVHRLFDPQRAVVVERGDPLVRRHKVGPAFGRDFPHERQDRLLRWPSFHDGSGSSARQRNVAWATAAVRLPRPQLLRGRAEVAEMEHGRAGDFEFERCRMARLSSD